MPGNMQKRNIQKKEERLCESIKSDGTADGCPEKNFW